MYIATLMKVVLGTLALQMTLAVKEEECYK